MHIAILVSAVFLASLVEMVEALTIVLAVGMTRGWRSARRGVIAALVALAMVIATLGSALASVPIDSLRLAVGTLLLIFGLQWLRKAILRGAGLKAMHNEDAIFASEIDELRRHDDRPDEHDWYGFTVAFKGVFLEGLEVAFIVVSFGGAQHQVGLATAGAVTALALVLALGAIVHAPLSRVPENTLKLGVGVMLTAFGIFWCAEGAGIAWPGSDASLPLLVGYVAALAWMLTAWLGRGRVAVAKAGELA